MIRYSYLHFSLINGCGLELCVTLTVDLKNKLEQIRTEQRREEKKSEEKESEEESSELKRTESR
jgi:Holliday junction resolvasome RuvABC DNA-binding subunit